MKSTHIEGDLWSFDEKLATTKKDRLSVRYVDAGKHGFLFHELLWERRVKTKWKRHKTISEFALSPLGTRGALRVHSFDPTNAEAVVMLYEGTRRSNGTWSQTFGWHSLSLLDPSKQRLLQACGDPNEHYAG